MLTFYSTNGILLRIDSISDILKVKQKAHLLEVIIMLPGVYSATKKNGENYFRASITYKGKHISLGSYDNESDAYKAYQLSGEILSCNSQLTIEDYPTRCILSFHKWVVLINFRDNNLYFKNPIYIRKHYFLYYIDQETFLRFDADDLFYYARHKILKRGGHLFVSDYGMQVNILSRYGIKNYAVPGRDYIFSNGNDKDFSYHNIEVINHFHGVTKTFKKGQSLYITKIHINGDYLIGCYPTEAEAAIAYNKAVLILNNSGLSRNYPTNFVEGINEITYAAMFQRLRISKKFLAYVKSKSII